MGTWVALALALLRAVPVLDQWFKLLAARYIAEKIRAHDKAFTDALAELVKNNDQRALEHAAGMATAGQPAEDRTDVITRPRPK